MAGTISWAEVRITENNAFLAESTVEHTSTEHIEDQDIDKPYILAPFVEGSFEPIDDNGSQT